MSTRAYVALGSNLGDRRAHLAAALAALEEDSGVAELRRSRLYETAPVGPPGQGPYLNAVVSLDTERSPEALLELLLSIERANGRTRSGLRDEARSLDLDLLLYGERCVDAPSLRVPHPRLHERAFVLAPLRDLAPALCHPVLGETVEVLARRALAAAPDQVAEVDW